MVNEMRIRAKNLFQIMFYSVPIYQKRSYTRTDLKPISFPTSVR
jgi:hypothetical protein